MADFPTSLQIPATASIISTVSPESPVFGIVGSMGLVPASGAWPAANRTIYVPFQVQTTCTAFQMFTYNGTTAAGNTDVGIMDSNGVRLVSSGATAQSGTSTIQVFNIADTVLVPGTYYIAVGQSLNTSTFFRIAPAQQILMGCRVMQEAVGTIPATATFATIAPAYCPVAGIATYSMAM